MHGFLKAAGCALALWGAVACQAPSKQHRQPTAASPAPVQPKPDSVAAAAPPRGNADPAPAYQAAADSVLHALGFLLMNNAGTDEQMQFELANQNGTPYLLVSFGRDLLRFNSGVDYSLSNAGAIPEELEAKHHFAPHGLEPEFGQVIVFRVVG